MSDFIGNIAVPMVSPSGTFPLTVDFGFSSTKAPSTVTHLTAAGDYKREQRYYIGPNPRTYEINRECTIVEIAALKSFYEGQQGPHTPFTFHAPLNAAGAVETITAKFLAEPLVIESQPGNVYHVTVKLVECNTDTTGPVYSVNETLPRFPDSTLATALTAQAQTIIQLIHIVPKLAGYPNNIYLSDRRCVVGGIHYQPRLLSCKGIRQVATALPNVSPESDDVTMVFGNADRVMRQLADDAQLDRAAVTYSLYHVDSQILVNLWTGEIIAGGWQSSTGPEFTVKCSDKLASPFLLCPPNTIDRKCYKPYNDLVQCPFASESTGLDTVHFPTVVSTFCDHGYDTPNGCLALGMKHRFGGVVAVPQAVRSQDNSTGFAGFARDTFVSTSIIAESAYGRSIPIVVTDVDFPVNGIIIAGRDEGDFYEAMAVICRGPVVFSLNGTNGIAIGAQVDGQFNHGYPNNLGLRYVPGNDPAASTDYVSLDQSGDQTGGDFRKVFSGASTYLDNFSAGVALAIVRRKDEPGLQLTTLDQHSMQVYLNQGWQGWVWTAPGVRSLQSMTKPVWFLVNLYLLCKGLFTADIATAEAEIDIPGCVLSQAVCDLVIPRVVEASEGDETQWKTIGTIDTQRALRDWMNDVAVNFLGFFRFDNGKLYVGVRDNASAVTSYTAGNIIWNTVQVAALGPQYTKLSASFADAEYTYQSNSAVFQDDDYVLELGGGVYAPHLPSNINLAFTVDISPASRMVNTRGREEMGGVNAAERKAGRKVIWKTTVLGLDTAAGMVASIADPEYTGKVRVESWELDPNTWSIQLTGRTVTDSMYDLVAGPKPADVVPGLIPPTRFPDPLTPVWMPNYETPMLGDVVFGQDQLSFNVTQTYAKKGDGTKQAVLQITGQMPIDVFEPNTVAPIVNSCTFTTTGGFLAGGKSYFICLSMKAGNGLSSPRSNILQVFIPTGTNTNKITLGTITWPAAPASGWDNYIVYACTDDARLLTAQDDTGTGTPTTVVQSAVLRRRTYNPPSVAYKAIRAKVKIGVHFGTIGERCTSVSTGTIGVAALAGLTDNWIGRVVASVAQLDGSAPRMNFLCTGQNLTTGDLFVTPDPLTAGVQVQDIIIVRHKADVISATTIGDTQIINGRYPTGLIPSPDPRDNVGQRIYIIAGTGAYQSRLVTANSDHVYTVDRPWDVLPDATSIWIVCMNSWPYQGETSAANSSQFGQVSSATVVVDNLLNQAVLVGGFMVDVNGNESPEDLTPLIETFTYGELGDTTGFSFQISAPAA